MSRDDFTTYRRAFDSLLTCAASDADNSECVEGWRRDAAAFLRTDRDRQLAGTLVEYYLKTILRPGAAKAATFCDQPG
jgi:hypothetical protein